MKTVSRHQYKQAWRIQEELSRSRFVRKAVDGAEQECALVFHHSTEDLLSFVRNRRATKTQIKRVLLDALTGIRDLHREHWVHGVSIHKHARIVGRSNSNSDLDVKPSNVLVSWRCGKDNCLENLDVVMSDTEDAAKGLEGECLEGVRPGNVYWRSPEANFGNIIDRKMDIFSFGSLVGFAHCPIISFLISRCTNTDLSSHEKQVIYFLSGLVIFAYDSLKEGQTAEMAVVANQLSYFGHTVTQEFIMRFDDAVANAIADKFEGFGKTGRTRFDKLMIVGIDAEDRNFLRRS